MAWHSPGRVFVYMYCRRLKVTNVWQRASVEILLKSPNQRCDMTAAVLQYYIFDLVSWGAAIYYSQL